MYFIEYAFLESYHIIRYAHDDATTLCGLFVLIQAQLIPLEYSEESLIVNSCFLVTPEVLNEFINFRFIDS